MRARLEKAGAALSAIDGVRVKTEEGWWLLRASNTQDVLVARAEARDEAGLEILKKLLVDQLRDSRRRTASFLTGNLHRRAPAPYKRGAGDAACCTRFALRWRLDR